MNEGNPVPRRPSKLIGITARQWRRALDQRLRSFELPKAMWSPLLNLARSDVPMRQGDLTAALLLHRSAMVRIVANLEVAGLVTRDEETDRRAKLLTVTERGGAFAREVEAIADELERELPTDYPPEQIGMVRSVIAKICAAPPGQVETAGK
jgi:MarR family transcriptional regulator for hemolysin